MFEALCDEGTTCLKPYVMKVNKQKVIKNLFQPKKKTENTWKCPHPTNRVPIFNCSCFFLINICSLFTFHHNYETFFLKMCFKIYSFINENPF